MATDAERVRAQLGERIPVGGTEADTLFTDAEIDDLLTDNGGDIELAVIEGWKVKTAEAVDLVNTQEGTSKRNMSDIHDHALGMARSYQPGGVNATPVTHIHKIERT